MIQHLPVLAIAIPLLAAFITSLLHGVNEKIRNWFVILILIIESVLIGVLCFDVLATGIHTYAIGASLPSLTAPSGIPFRIILVVDEMAALISLVTISITTIAGIYAWKFMEGYKRLDKFYALILVLIASMMGLCFTGDFFTLFVFLEIASVSSAGLIAFFKKEGSFEAAFKYLVLSSLGTLFLLFGVGILYGQYGLLNMAAIASEALISFSFLDKVALSLIISALLLKIPSIPVHMWKPDAFQEMPVPIMVIFVASSSVGLYVLFRIGFSVFPVMSSILGWLIILLGMLSIFIGATMALFQTNLKRMMGYVAVAEIGYVMLGGGVGLIGMPQLNALNLTALSGAIFHIINDVLNISLLLLIIGIVFYCTGKRDMRDLSGLAHHFPFLTGLFLIGILAISGVPPFNGFVSKLMIYESVFYFNPLLAVIGILGSVFMLAIFIKIFTYIFLGNPYKGRRKNIPLSMMIIVSVLAFFTIFLGLFPQLIIDQLVNPAVNALINSQAYIGSVI